MSLRICEPLSRIFACYGKRILASAWSTNSYRGLKSFDDVPRAPRVPALGSMPYLEEAGGQTYMHKFIDDLHKKLGPVFVANLYDNDLVFISDADANVKIFRAEGKYPRRATVESWRLYLEETGKKRGLFFMDGEEWQKARSIFNTFLLKKGCLEPHVQKISSICKNFVDVWKTTPPKHLKHQIYCWNVECIGEIVFGKNLGFVETLRHDDTQEYIDKRRYVEVLFQVYVESAKLADVKSLQEIKDSNTVSWTRFCEAMEMMLKYGDSYVQKAIEDCRAANPSESVKESIIFKVLKENLDEETIKAVVNDIFLGSPDTSSHTALWALYLLGKNPYVANKAREEIFSTLKREKLTLSTATGIPYINGIIKETLRLYSAAPFVNRTISSDVEICDYLIPAGTTVMSSLLTMGRDPVNYSDPNEFKPERWSLSRQAVSQNDQIILNKKAHTPFALGARSCIGKRVAELDLSLLLMEILTTFEWTVEEEIDPILKLMTVPAKEFELKNLRLL